jgi:hypothetical protein
MSTQHSYDISLPVPEVINRLKDETVSFESVFSLRSPLESYKTFMSESFIGTSRVVAKIDGQKFRLLTIGIMPKKGSSATANYGAMYGTIQHSNAGSTILAKFRIYPVWLVWVFIMLCVCAFSIVAAILVGILGAEMDSTNRVITYSFTLFFGVFPLIFVGAILLGARKQEIQLRRFLDEFVARVAT